MTTVLSSQYRRQYKDIFTEILAASPEGYYDEAALPSYMHRNPVIPWLFWRRIEAALLMAGDVQARSVLDFGCGGGVTLRYLHERGAIITACDNLSIDLAKKVCLKFNIKADIHSDLSQIRDRRFDIIFALDVLEHVKDLDLIIEQLIVMAGSGKIIVSGPTENLWYSLGRRITGFSGHYHERNIYDIEVCLKKKVSNVLL